MWKLTPSRPSRDGSAQTVALKQLAVDGTTISFSALSWAVRPPVQDTRNRVRKARVSRTPEIKIRILFGRSPAVKHLLVTLRSQWCHPACRSEARTVSG